jgi:hypothetical protein
METTGGNSLSLDPDLNMEHLEREAEILITCSKRSVWTLNSRDMCNALTIICEYNRSFN